MLAAAGYHVSSGNELVRIPRRIGSSTATTCSAGRIILAAGVSSFGHLQGVHYQNLDQLEEYLDTVEGGELPINRAMRPTPHQLLIREFVLQMKEGRVAARHSARNSEWTCCRNSPSRSPTSRRRAI